MLVSQAMKKKSVLIQNRRCQPHRRLDPKAIWVRRGGNCGITIIVRATRTNLYPVGYRHVRHEAVGYRMARCHEPGPSEKPRCGRGRAARQAGSGMLPA